jgi:hypothetical protein
MALSARQRMQTVRTFRGASDGYIRRPLWEFHPYVRPLVLSERARRGFLTIDPEPIGDPEYS